MNQPVSSEKEKVVLKYKLKLTIGSKQIGTKPFVLNVLGNICEAMIKELNDISSEKISTAHLIVLTPQCDVCGPDERVKLQIGDKSISLKDWVQEMFDKTLRGFISSLKSIPPEDELKTLPIMIEISPK
jgi:hypothetical protein